MFIILLKFGENKAKAPDLMQAHKDWIDQGFKDGVFMLVGSLQPNQGGAVLAHNSSREDIEMRVRDDPFVAEKVVEAEILELSPARAMDQIKFLIP
jgi:uncharacterized protein YciI